MLGRRRHVGHEDAALRDGQALRAEARPRHRAASSPARVVTDCALSARRILGETGSAPLHPVEALAEAYGIAPDVRLRSGRTA